MNKYNELIYRGWTVHSWTLNLMRWVIFLSVHARSAKLLTWQTQNTLSITIGTCDCVW